MKMWNSIKLLTFGLILTLHFTTSSSFCPQYCACNDTSLSVRCHSSSNLRVVPIVLNPLIKSLTLSQNQIKDITLSLQFYQELNYLDISVNQVATLGKGNFESLRALEFLNVSYNQVKALESGVFQGLATLSLLDLTGNQIDRVERDVFWGLRDVKEIILDRNRLEFIDWDLFRGLEALVKISVQYNFIQVIEPSVNLVTPWTLKNLQILDVSSNQLTRVKDNSLVTFSHLKELNLCCNYIHTLEDKAFSSLPVVEKVNLSQNRLGKVPTTALETLAPSLRQLDLSSNRFSEILPSSSFRSLMRLQVLRLNDNPSLYSFHPDSLAELLNLVNFEADYLPNLTEFSASLLSNKPALQRFSLKYSQISVVPSKLLEDLENTVAKSLDLTGNPIDCNCSAYPLFHYLQHHAQLGGSIGGNTDDNFFLEEFPVPVINNSSHAHQPYVDQSHSSSQNIKTRRKSFFYLSSVRCHNPLAVSGILVKDLKSGDFSECFTSQDDFQILVICIAAVLLSLIFLAVGVKLCCFSGARKGLRRCSCKCPWGRGKGTGDKDKTTFCGRSCPCFNGRDKDMDLDKCDRLFEGFRRDIPISAPHNMQIQQNPFAGVQVQHSPNGKLFFSADNSSPAHNSYGQYYNHATTANHPLSEEDYPSNHHYNSNTLRLQPHHTLNKFQPLPPQPPLPAYNYNYTFNPKASSFQNHNSYLQEEGNEYTNPHDLNLDLSGGGGHHHNNVVALHYDYDPYCGNNAASASTNKVRHGQASKPGKHHTLGQGAKFTYGNGSGGGRERLNKQVPSVLV